MADKPAPPPPPPKKADKAEGEPELSPEGVPYQQGARGREREVREESEEDRAHEDAVEEARQVVKDAERAT